MAGKFYIRSLYGLIYLIGLTHLRYKIKYNKHYSLNFSLDSLGFNAIDFSVQPRKSYILKLKHTRAKPSWSTYNSHRASTID